MIDMLHMSLIYWAPFMELKKATHVESLEYRCYAWRSMYHLLTKDGLSELQSIIEI